MSWLRDIFLESRDDSTEVERIRYAQAYILEMIGAGELCWGSTMLATLYREMCRTTPPNKAKIGGGIIRRVMLEYLPLEDIRLLLDQRSEFQWTPYEDPTIRVVIMEEFFQNPNIWHVKVPLVNYAIIEMHQTDRVLRQFGF
ncbi:hypothetical protein J1N35_018439 [Gossypium stocksii]|uniref:Aminotransferase-like plant mobile domain-containing protein n=1 Tax=Gossypium stocksii TaxID=47602 RepID=A0A9D3VPS5_9ROSI|nr:hypothetical protein J1N35_018439 [Gossypium stocksii]